MTTVIIGVSDRDTDVLERLRWSLAEHFEQRGWAVVAEIHGESLDETWGVEQSWWAAVEPAHDPGTYPFDAVKSEVIAIAERHGQEAVAWTLGDTELLETGVTKP